MKRRSFFGALAAMVLSPMAKEKPQCVIGVDPAGPTTVPMQMSWAEWQVIRRRERHERELAAAYEEYVWTCEKQPYRGPVRIDYLTADTYDKLGVVIGGGHGRPIRVFT